MRIWLTAATAMAALSMGGTARAQADGKGVYVGLSGGIASVKDVDVRYYDVAGTFGGSGSSDSADGSIDLSNSAGVGGVVGYDFGTIRTDVEIAYARSKVRSLTLRRVNGAAVTIAPEDAEDICLYLEVDGCRVSGNTIAFDHGGRIRQLSALANLWIDLPLGKTITPYAGGGVGVAGFEMDGEGKARFAWQLGAGVAMRLTGKVALTIDYRHRQAKGGSLPYDELSGTEIGQIRTDTLGAGLRVTF